MSSVNLTRLPPTGRVSRNPKHTFQVNSLAQEIRPFMIAPVLPGETLKNLYFESRAVSDPIKNKLIGWSQEYHFFYCRVTDLLSDAIRDMFIDPTNTDLTATLGSASNSTSYYQAKGAVNYLQQAYQRIVTEYFRDEGDDYADFISGSPMAYAKWRDSFWMDSITDSDEMAEGANIATATTGQDLEALMMAYQQLQALGIANMTYEDWLRTYGVAIPNKDENKPERLFSFTEWQYPTNTISQGTGAVSSAVSWVFKNSSKDVKFFKEPGFIVGLAVTRPKVYFAGLAGNMSGFLGRAWDWLPNYMNEAAANPLPITSLKQFAADAGPLGDRTTPTESYWVDMRDLFLYGDQFQNVLPFADPPVNNGSYNAVALPGTTVAGNAWKYPTNATSDAMVKSFFVTGGSEQIRHDGMVSLAIAGKQIDYTMGSQIGGI